MEWSAHADGTKLDTRPAMTFIGDPLICDDVVAIRQHSLV